MTISFVAGVGGTDTAFGGSVVVPAGVAAGDRMLAVVATNSVAGGYTQATPAGWELVETSYGAAFGGDMFAAVYTRIATATDHGTTVAFNVSPTGSKDAVALAAWRGDVTTPEVLASAADGVTGAVSVTTIPSPDITVPALPELLVAIGCKKGGTTGITFTPPAGFTQRALGQVTGGGAVASCIAGMSAAATGTTAVADWNTSASSIHGVGLLVGMAEGTPPPMAAPVFRRFTSTGWFPAP